MRNLELDIGKIKLISVEKEAENYEFRAFLKGVDSDIMDKIVLKLNKEVISKIDCQECGNCCKSLRPCVTDSEIESLSLIDKVSKKDYILKYVERGDFEDIKYLKDTPCRYLKDKSCSIYQSRPFDCKTYPHTEKKDFVSRTIGMIENYGICPIVFNVFERLKEKLNYRYN